MKKITLLFIALFVMNTLFSQILYEEGIVKGKNVTYRVSRGKERFEKLFTYIQNVNNPDTTYKEVPERDVIPAQMLDLEAQLSVILHDFFSAEELKECRSVIAGITLRLDAPKRKLLQVTNFFYLSATNSFWGNLSPDRLYELEQLIMKKLELPYKLQETYIKDDFLVGFFIKDIKEAKKCRKRAMETWKKEDIEVRDVTEEWNARWMKKKKYKEVLL